MALAPAAEPSTPSEPADAVPALQTDIVPGERFGPVRGGMSRAEIARLFPDVALVDTDIDVGEGHTVPGLVVPLPQGRQFSVVFATNARDGAEKVQDIGEAWQVHGVGIGSDLHALHQALGEPFDFLGFGWDYSGTVLLESTRYKAHKGTLWIRLSPGNRKAPAYSKMLGDRVFSSGADGIEALELRVSDLRVHLD
ncbi:MAG: hypothetical protein ACI8PZ_001363 [Myxococcota bacterium]|jgi:hypothetical protein